MTSEQFSLEGRLALVTGASRGIGRAIALGLAEAHADLLLVGRSGVESTREEVLAAGGKAEVVVADLSSREETASAAAHIAQRYAVDVVVNCAGIIRRAPELDATEADWDDVMAVNLDAPRVLSRALAAGMVERGRGKIINIASLLSFQGGINVASYTTSKHALQGLTRALANELAPAGVQVNAIAPGYIDTDNTAALHQDEHRSAQILSRIPAGRWGKPSDLVGAAVFLAAPASDYITGHTLVVDGGWMSR